MALRNVMAKNVIVLDVDGVLNVAVKDLGRGSVNLDPDNLTAARRLIKSDNFADAQVARRLISAADHSLESVGEHTGSTYSSFIADQATAVSDVLVERFASLIKGAGDSRLVVLASSWRRPEHMNMVKTLEQSIAEHLGRPFEFDARTAVRKERSALDRIETIGAFLETYSQEKSAPAGGQRVIVLDDLFCTAMSDIPECNSVKLAERRIRKWMPASASVSVKLIHTFAECSLDDGDHMRIGSGLTTKHFEEATLFLAEATACLQEVQTAATAAEVPAAAAMATRINTSVTDSNSRFLVRSRVSL